MSDEQLSPEGAAACHVRIFTCAGRTAIGNMARCHPTDEPGGYDVALAMTYVNESPLPLDVALAAAKRIRHMLALVITIDRANAHMTQTNGPIDLDAMAREVSAQ